MQAMIKFARRPDEHRHAASAIVESLTFYRDVDDTCEGIRVVDMLPNLSPQNLVSAGSAGT
jgi:hypothetical protein